MIRIGLGVRTNVDLGKYAGARRFAGWVDPAANADLGENSSCFDCIEPIKREGNLNALILAA